MEITIKKFRNIDSQKMIWQVIQIEGFNWAGKSNTLRAIEWCLFWTVYWKQKWISISNSNKTRTIVSLNIDEDVYHKDSSEKTNQYIDDMLKPIMFCELLDQDSFIIKRILTQILLQEQAKKLFWIYRKNNLDDSITLVKKIYNEQTKLYSKASERLEVLQGLIEKISVTQEQIEQIESAIEKKQMQLTALSSKADMDIDQLIETKKRLEQDIETYDIALSSYDVQSKIYNKEREHLETQLSWLNQKRCPTCNTIIDDEELQRSSMEALKQQYIELKNNITHLTANEMSVFTKKTSTQYQLDEINIKLLSANWQDEKAILKTQIQKDLDYLNKELIIANEKLATKMSYEDEINNLALKLSAMSDDEIFRIYEVIKPKWELNRLLQKTVLNFFEWYRIVLFEDSVDWIEPKSVFKLYDEFGNEYKDLSRSQKLKMNIMLSIRIMSIIKSKLPLLIDDTEMFSDRNLDLIIKELTTKWVNAILTKVSQWQLTVTAIK